MAAARYIELNPVRAGLVEDPAKYQWSSCKAHLTGEYDILVKNRPLLDLFPDWEELLYQGLSEEEKEMIKKHEKTGRPLGNKKFIERVELLRG